MKGSQSSRQRRGEEPKATGALMLYNLPPFHVTQHAIGLNTIEKNKNKGNTLEMYLERKEEVKFKKWRPSNIPSIVVCYYYYSLSRAKFRSLESYGKYLNKATFTASKPLISY